MSIELLVAKLNKECENEMSARKLKWKEEDIKEEYRQYCHEENEGVLYICKSCKYNILKYLSKKKMKEEWKEEIQGLKQRIMDLELQLKYIPGGIVYEEAKEHFSLLTTQLEKY